MGVMRLMLVVGVLVVGYFLIRSAIKEFRSLVKDVEGVEIVVAPPFTAVHAVAEAARNSNVAVAAQDVYWETEGAFTGEVSGPMLVDAGCQYVIVGHSERRQFFGETDDSVNRKLAAVLPSRLDEARHRRPAPGHDPGEHGQFVRAGRGVAARPRRRSGGRAGHGGAVLQRERIPSAAAQPGRS